MTEEKRQFFDGLDWQPVPETLAGDPDMFLTGAALVGYDVRKVSGATCFIHYFRRGNEIFSQLIGHVPGDPAPWAATIHAATYTR